MEKKSLQVFVKKLILILAILIISDQICGHILRYFYFKQVWGKNHQLTLTIDSIKTDLLVIGSSRATHHYVPEFFEEKLKMSFYNCGSEGNFILFGYGIFKSIIYRYNPKIIIFDLIPNQLAYDNLDYERLSNLLPYYKDHYELKDIIELRSPFEKYKLYSSVYPFNSLLINMMNCNLESKKNKYEIHKGYMPLYNKMNCIKANNFLKKPFGEIDKNKIDALNDIAATCKKKKIRLVFVYSPIFSNSPDSIETKIIEDISKTQKCQYFDFSNDSTFDNHPEYFDDNFHLNDNGARKFSEMFSKLLQG